MTDKKYREVLFSIAEVCIWGGFWPSSQMIDVILDLRTSYKKYAKEIEHLHYYPRHNIEKAVHYIKYIREVCEANEIEIQVKQIHEANHMAAETGGKAYKVPSDVWESGQFVTLYKEGRDITKLVTI